MSDRDVGRASRIKFEQTLLVAFLCTAALIALYYVMPLGSTDSPVWWRLLIAATVFTAALAFEIRAVVRHDEPMRRAVVSLAVMIPLFVVLYAWIYLTMSVSNPATFGHRMTRTEALYLTVTVLSTVGFGDITPKTDPARIVTMIQMVSDVAILALGIRMLIHFGSRASARRRNSADAGASDGDG